MQIVYEAQDLRALTARIVFGGVAAAISLLILLRPIPESVVRMSRRQFDSALIGMYALMRVVLFAVVFGVLHQPVRGDLPAFYLPQARFALHGLRPYRDYYSSYGPLNSPMNGLLLRIYNSGLTLIAFQSLCDIAGVVLLLVLLRRFLDETTMRRTGLLLLAQPLLLWNGTIDGRNEALTALLLITAMLLLGRKDLLSGASASSTLVLVKFLPLLYLPSILAAARRRGLWLLGAALFPVLVFGFMALRHFPVLLPLQVEGSVTTSGGIGYMVSSITGWSTADRSLDVLTALALAGVLVWTGRAILRAGNEHARLWALSLAMTALMMTLVAFSKKTYPAYLTGVSGFMAAYVAQVTGIRGRRPVAWIYCALIFVSLFASSLAFVGLGNMGADGTHYFLMHGNHVGIVSFVFVCIPALCCIGLLMYMMLDCNGPVGPGTWVIEPSPARTALLAEVHPSSEAAG